MTARLTYSQDCLSIEYSNTQCSTIQSRKQSAVEMRAIGQRPLFGRFICRIVVIMLIVIASSYRINALAADGSFAGSLSRAEEKVVRIDRAKNGLERQLDAISERIARLKRAGISGRKLEMALRDSQALAEKLEVMRGRLRREASELLNRIDASITKCGTPTSLCDRAAEQDLLGKKNRIQRILAAHPTVRSKSVPEVNSALDAGHDREEISDLLADSAEKLRRELGQVQSRISFVRRRRRSMRHSRSSKHRLFNESLPQRLAQVQTDSFSLAASADSSSNDSSQAGSDGSAKSANERSSANVAADESDLFMPKVAGAVANDVASPVNADQVGASNDSDSGQVEAMADMGSAAPQQLNSAPPQVPQDQGSDASSIPTVGFGSVSSGAVSQASSPTGVVVGRSSIDHGAFRLERRSPALKSMSETDLKKEKKRLEEMLKSIQQKQSSLR